MKSTNAGYLQPDARELILNQDQRFFCETYIFDPASREESLGHLFAVGEVEDRGGVGRELLDLVMSAIQKEYYRDSGRSPSTSFELALHQANLILHDAVAQGVRDWMGYFHVAIVVLAGSTLHISVASEAAILLARKSHVSNISTGLSHSPITNPLRTFSQVASGAVTGRDTLFLGTHYFPELFRPADITRFAIDHSAATITTRLQQLYIDQGSQLPVASLVISVLPQYVVTPREEVNVFTRPPRAPVNLRPTGLKPRQPLVIRRSSLVSIIMIIGRAVKLGGQKFMIYVWPYLKIGGTKSRQALVAAQQATVASPIRLLPISQTITQVKSWPSRLVRMLRQWVDQLPTTSKIFAGVAIALAIALTVSVVLLHQKRIRDAEIQQASEILHEARTKTEAAASAMVYNNRDQAQGYLREADKLTEQVAATGLYQQELISLKDQITTARDRLEKITRPKAENIRTIGDFASLLGSATPTSLFFVNANLYTFNPASNSVLKMGQNGQTTAVSHNTQGIGFFTTGSVQAADKTITLLTNAPGVVVFDTKDETLHTQDIQFPSAKPQLSAVAVFSNKLYLSDQASKNIFVYSKTLRGYANPSPWITDQKFPADTIRSFGIDGNVFALLGDGNVRRLFKGAPADFTMEKIDPSLVEATRLLVAEDLRNIYVLDPAHKRIVVLTKKGELVNQIFLDNTSKLADIAIDAASKTLYALDGTRVLALPLDL